MPKINLPDIKLKIKRQHPFLYGDLTKRVSALIKLQKTHNKVYNICYTVVKPELLKVSSAAEDAIHQTESLEIFYNKPKCS